MWSGSGWQSSTSRLRLFHNLQQLSPPYILERSHTEPSYHHLGCELGYNLKFAMIVERLRLESYTFYFARRLNTFLCF